MFVIAEVAAFVIALSVATVIVIICVRRRQGRIMLQRLDPYQWGSVADRVQDN